MIINKDPNARVLGSFQTLRILYWVTHGPTLPENRTRPLVFKASEARPFTLQVLGFRIFAPIHFNRALMVLNSGYIEGILEGS